MALPAFLLHPVSLDFALVALLRWIERKIIEILGNGVQDAQNGFWPHQYPILDAILAFISCIFTTAIKAL